MFRLVQGLHKIVVPDGWIGGHRFTIQTIFPVNNVALDRL